MSIKFGDEDPSSLPAVRLFLAGDVMTGRGIDQILPHPADPRLWERYASSATDYLDLAEAANGSIARPVDFAYVWGEALEELDRRQADFRLINLETSVTDSRTRLDKGINYKMSPANLPCLVAAGIDCCNLANNHVLDWGAEGLEETMASLERAGIGYVGAGRNAAAAAAPLIKASPGKGRVVVFGFGCGSSGIPPDWAATEDQPGVNLLPDLSLRTADSIGERVQATKRPDDIVVASIHWGGNWGYRVPSDQRSFARALIERAGVELVHGHSSHHAKAIEVHRGKLILYGCGDFLNDYEGISGYEEFRDDLALMYLPTVVDASGELLDLAMVPFQIRNFRLSRATPADAKWIGERLTREGAGFGTRALVTAEHSLQLAWSNADRGALYS